MKKVSHKKGSHTDEVQIYVESTPVHLIIIKYDTKLEKDYVKIKLFRDPMSQNHIYKILTWPCLEMLSKRRYGCLYGTYKWTSGFQECCLSALRSSILIRYWVVNRYFSMICFFVEVGSTTTTHLNRNILGLGTYFFLLMRCQIKIARCAAEWGSRMN